MIDAVIDFLVFSLKASVILGVYFAPTIIAHVRTPLVAFRVFNLNLFLGWTLIGWIGVLVWALKIKPEDTP